MTLFAWLMNNRAKIPVNISLKLLAPSLVCPLSIFAHRMNYILYLFLICFSAHCLANNDEPTKQFIVKRTTETIIVDGVLDESVWKGAPGAKDFVQYFPQDTVAAKGQTEIYMVYDDENLYVGIICYGSGNNWNVNSLRRDYRAGGMDNITLIFDSFEDQTNAFFFGINPEGVIREGIISNGGNDFRDFDESWDNKWHGEAKKHDGYYSAELVIPFGTLRYNKGSKKWKFGAYRFDTQDNEWSTWTGIPNNFPMMNLAYNGDLIWEEPLEHTARNLSFIPFVSAGFNNDYESASPHETNASIGGDVKIGISSGLNLDLTINPDFSQVEVDRQVTDLSRFEIFFPERRQFFLENADLFGGFGTSSINPFFSRRIGVAKNLDDELIQNRILGGARISGKVNDNLRLGLLNMQTESNLAEGVHASNFAVLAVQQKVLARSNLSFIFVNRQLQNVDAEQTDLNAYNRIAGLDFNYANNNNTWSGKVFYHASMSPSTDNLPWAHGLTASYDVKNIGFSWSHEYVHEDYLAEVGFVRRTNYMRINPEFRFTKYPNGDFINEYSYQGQMEVIWRPGFGKTDHELSLALEGTLANNSRFQLEIQNNYVYLFDDFDPTGTDSNPLPADTDYNYFNFSGFISGDQSKRVTYRVRQYFGEYFNGWRIGTGGQLTLNYPPKGSVSLDVNWNYFDMPYLEEKKQTFLIGPRIDYTFSKEIFLTTFIQYNTQAKNTNINTRFQWRFAPVSDFYLVYTDNYLTGNVYDPSERFAFSIKNRSIVAKLTYWLNI